MIELLTEKQALSIIAFDAKRDDERRGMFLRAGIQFGVSRLVTDEESYRAWTATGAELTEHVKNDMYRMILDQIKTKELQDELIKLREMERKHKECLVYPGPLILT